MSWIYVGVFWAPFVSLLLLLLLVLSSVLSLRRQSGSMRRTGSSVNAQQIACMHTHTSQRIHTFPTEKQTQYCTELLQSFISKEHIALLVKKRESSCKYIPPRKRKIYIPHNIEKNRANTEIAQIHSMLWEKKSATANFATWRHLNY